MNDFFYCALIATAGASFGYQLPGYLSQLIASPAFLDAESVVDQPTSRIHITSARGNLLEWFSDRLRTRTRNAREQLLYSFGTPQVTINDIEVGPGIFQHAHYHEGLNPQSREPLSLAQLSDGREAVPSNDNARNGIMTGRLRKVIRQLSKSFRRSRQGTLPKNIV
ncbi:hypothetical protein BJ165DRAFT_616510 [Panaeolus papilionaceus]|nr:hypothetical protein BJ165DRAFT_616510 [Panaeolus papilionaceus]